MKGQMDWKCRPKGFMGTSHVVLTLSSHLGCLDPACIIIVISPSAAYLSMFLANLLGSANIQDV
jgi:hypothetical protein